MYLGISSIGPSLPWGACWNMFMIPQERYYEAHRYRPPQEIYLIPIKAEDTRLLPVVPDCFKTREMCEKAVDRYLYLLRYVPDWFVTDQQIEIWHDNDEYCNVDKLIEWYDGYKARKAQKVSIKEELLPIAWHPSRYCDWCMPEDEKRKIVGINIGLFVSDDRTQNFLT